ncbi:hypothetical protein N9O57_01075 [bacterium]|nr:hypothetical protein [bacterium]
MKSTAKLLLIFTIFSLSKLSLAKLKAASQMVCDETYCYYVKPGGWLYKKEKLDASGATETPATWGKDVKEVISHKGKVMYIKGDGSIFLMAKTKKGHKHLVSIAKRAQSKRVMIPREIYSDGNNIYMINEDKELLVHEGDISTYELTKMNWRPQRDKKFFQATGLKDIAKIEEVNGRILFTKNNGRITDIYGFAVNPSEKHKTSDLAISSTQRHAQRKSLYPENIQKIHLKKTKNR